MSPKRANHVDNYIDKLTTAIAALEKMREAGVEDIIGVSISVGKPEIRIRYDDVYMVLPKEPADVKKNADGSYDVRFFRYGATIRAILSIADKKGEGVT